MMNLTELFGLLPVIFTSQKRRLVLQVLLIVANLLCKGFVNNFLKSIADCAVNVFISIKGFEAAQLADLMIANEFDWLNFHNQLFHLN